MSEIKNYICIDGKKAELTKEQLKALGIELKKVSPFEKKPARVKELYYYIDSKGQASKDEDMGIHTDTRRYETANYCTDANLMQQRALKETLNRLLWRFSMENGGDEIDWRNKNQHKYYIEYKYDTDLFNSECFYYIKNQGTEYFISREIANRAIDEIVKPFIAEHPEFIW